MSETINLPRLIALLAEQADVQPAEARKFLHELFANVETALFEGETVVIKGVGEFVKSDDPANPVLFRADDELASIANEPFAAFDAVELNEGAAEEIMRVGLASTPKIESESSKPDETEAGHECVSFPEPEIIDKDVEKDKVDVEDAGACASERLEAEKDIVESDGKGDAEALREESPALDIEPEETPQQLIEAGDSQAQVDYTGPEPQERIVYVQQQASHGMWLMLGVLIGLIAGLVGGYFAGKYMAQYELPAEEDMVFDEDTLSSVSIFDNPVDTVVQSGFVPADVKDISEPTPAVSEPKKPEPIYDTVSSKRYLAIIAGEHYGVKNYWIFIYNANPNLGDPNKIAPGTKVLIPTKESFMEDTKAATDDKARRLLNELSKKYKL